VINVAEERDMGRLRQAAVLLQLENDRLHKRLREIAGSDAARLQLELDKLREQAARQRQALFGRSSEKQPGSEEAKAPGTQAAPRTGHGPRAQEKLPIVEIVHTLEEADMACPCCGGRLGEMSGQFEEADEVDVVERSFRILRRKRQKYRCSCGAIDTALGAPKHIVGGRYSLDFAIAVVVAKYLDHMPLARQERQMRRHGLEVTTATLFDQIHGLSVHLVPTYEGLLARVLDSPVIGADETTWQMMEKQASKKWWAWSLTCQDAVYYRIAPTRKAEVPADLLAAYSGVVVCDGYASYPKARKMCIERRGRRGPPPFTLAHCWSHVRRRFIEALPNYPSAATAVDLIGKLYEVEREAALWPDAATRPARIAQLRETRSRPVVRELREWMMAQRVLGQSGLGRAIEYAHGVWAGLELYLGDARIPICNNGAERGMRGIAVGRKNHYGSRSVRGTEVAALFYSLVETAKLAGVDPAAYLRTAALRAIANPGTVTLPSDLAGI
jgi:transposase